ncbi:MAG TPA: hypothetical protein VJG13_06900 [Thermoanaerobaculia bacterium]|nr:hypothetical protein [Thermoanaerobaculia bacterium]
MDRLTRADLGALLRPRPWPCVSLYLPTHRRGKEIQQDPARLDALLLRAEERLRELELADDAVAEILDPVRELADDPTFWRFQADGLVLFAAPRLFRYYRLPVSFAESVAVGDQFAVKPLVPLLDGGGRYYVLGLSLNEVRLLEADRWSVRRLELGPVPASMDDALGYAQYYTGLGMHSASQHALHGQPGVVYHGHGDADEDRVEEDLRHYFQRIARALEDRLPDRAAPLVLAAVAEHLPLYREAAHDPRLVEEAVAGNPELTSDDELRLAAWPLVEPRLAAARRRALERYAELGGTGRAAAGVDPVVVAADRGLIESLFLDPQAERWGTYEPDLGRVLLHEQREPGDAELFELAVARTLETGGDVYALTPGGLGEGVEIAAVLRY